MFCQLPTVNSCSDSNPSCKDANFESECTLSRQGTDHNDVACCSNKNHSTILIETTKQSGLDRSKIRHVNNRNEFDHKRSRTVFSRAIGWCVSLAFLLIRLVLRLVTKRTTHDEDKNNSTKKPTIPSTPKQPLADIVYLSAMFPSHAYPMLGYFSELEAQGIRFDVYGPKNVVKLFSQGDRNCFEFPELEPNEHEGSTGVLRATCAGLLKTLPAIETMWDENKKKPSLIITDFSTTYALYLARKLNIPLLVYYPFYFTGDPKRLIFNAVEKGMMVKIGFSVVTQMLKVYRKYGVFFTSSEKMLIKGDQNVSSMPKFIGDMIFNPEKINYHHLGPGFRDDSTVMDHRIDFDYSLFEGDKIIFVSLGTHFLNSVPLKYFENIAEAFRYSNEKVLITASKEITELLGKKKLPSNIHVLSWVPQLRVLEHSKLFITHAGTGGWLEGIAAGVPMLCFPNYCEQFINSQVAERLNIGRVLNKKDRTPEKIRKIAEEILVDESLKDDCLKYKTFIDKTDSRKTFTKIIRSMLNDNCI